MLTPVDCEYFLALDTDFTGLRREHRRHRIDGRSAIQVLARAPVVRGKSPARGERSECAGFAGGSADSSGLAYGRMQAFSDYNARQRQAGGRFVVMSHSS